MSRIKSRLSFKCASASLNLGVSNLANSQEIRVVGPLLFETMGLIFSSCCNLCVGKNVVIPYLMLYSLVASVLVNFSYSISPSMRY